jgi:hypothetical protein
VKRKTLPLVLAACVAAGSLVACGVPGQRVEERICVDKATREPVGDDWCHSAPYGYEWADEDDLDFDKIKAKRKSSTVVKPVVPQVKQPVVVKPPAPKSGTGGMGRK